MGRSKKDQYTEKELNAARIGRAIAAAARVVILEEIHKNHIITNKALSERLLLSGSTVSQHLQILKETGFIESIYIGEDSGYILTKNGESEFPRIQSLF